MHRKNQKLKNFFLLKRKINHIVFILIIISFLSMPFMNLLIIKDKKLSFPISTLNYNSNSSYKISPYSSSSFYDSVNIGQGVMLQGFYWLCPEGNWWNTINDFIPEFSQIGIDSIWLPAPYKAAGTSGVSGMGYEPYDYYDLGSYNQKGNVRTRFGTETELRDLIANAHANNIAMVADIVVNHNNGGDLEYNPNVEDYTYTNFTNIASGRFPRNYTCFHPCEYETADEGVFANFPDLCHANPYVRNGLIEWGKWMANDIGFDGWRFDNVVNFDPAFVRDWMQNVSGWGVAEYWHGDKNKIQNYIESTENSVSAFDFALIYRLEDMCDGNGNFNMMELDYVNKLIDINPDNAVTFVMNHDTERDEYSRVDYNRHLAYAYILTHPGYPSVFWKDYFDLWYHSHITNLIRIRNELSSGIMQTRWTDSDVYIAEDVGMSSSGNNTGYIIALNDDPIENKTRTISTQWLNVVLYDLTNPYKSPVNVDSSGQLTFEIPANDYRILSPIDLRSELVFAPRPINHLRPYTEMKIKAGKINWSVEDPLLSGEWGFPIYSDPFDDTKGRPEDLSYLYLSKDHENLYIGFPYRENTWTSGGDLKFGIAFSTKTGGTNWGLNFHDQLNFAGSILPEFILYSSTDVDEDPSNEIQTATLYMYDNELENWKNIWNLTPIEDFRSSSIYRFATFKIPYEMLDLSEGDELSIMLFSTQEGKSGAADSVPNDMTTDDYGDAETWLSLPEPIILSIPEIDNNSNTNTNNGLDDSSSDDSQRVNQISINGYLELNLVIASFIGVIAILKHKLN